MFHSPLDSHFYVILVFRSFLLSCTLIYSLHLCTWIFVVFWVCILDKSVIDIEQLSNRSQTCTRLNRIMAPDVKVEKQNKNYTHIQLRFKCGLRVNPTKHTCADSELEVNKAPGPRA